MSFKTRNSEPLNQSSPGKAKPILLFLGVFLLAGIWQFYAKKKIYENGVFVKATVVNAEGYKGGIIITITYEFNGKKYETRVHGDLGKEDIGRQFFIKVLPSDPDGVVFLADLPVPKCLLNINSPPKGWQKMPVCD